MSKHVINQISIKGLLWDAQPIKMDWSRRNQHKYWNFHKDVIHEMKDSIQLPDQIELLVRDGHLREYVEKAITPLSGANRTG